MLHVKTKCATSHGSGYFDLEHQWFDDQAHFVDTYGDIRVAQSVSRRSVAAFP